MRLNLAELSEAGIVRALTPAALFELGNLAATLLILRATELLTGGSFSQAEATTLAIFLYAAHNAAAVTSLAAGQAIDRFNPRVVLATGATLYVAAYAVFAWNQHGWPILLAGFLLAGAGIGLGETAQSTTVALLPDHLRGSGYGALGLVQSVGSLGSSVMVSVLWATVSATAGFFYAAAWMAASVLVSRLLHGDRADSIETT